MSNKIRADLLAESSFSLSLSSGFFGYFAHVGFASAIYEKGLRPEALSGSSAGALVAAGLASGRSPAELQEIFLAIQKNDFWDPAWGWGYLKGQKIEDLMARYCVSTFSEVKIPLHISVFNLRRRQTEVVTEGSVAQACRASAAVPLLFHPVKVKSNLCWDGGIGDRAGNRGLVGSTHTPVIHYLHAEGLYSRIEDSYRYGELHKVPFFFKTQSPHKMGPLALDKGLDVIKHFQEKTRHWLEQPV